MQFDPATLAHTEAYKFLTGSILPRPIAWVSTIDEKGNTNLAPFSFFMGVCAKPLTLAFAPMQKPANIAKDTLNNIRTVKEFVVNVVPEYLADKMNLTSFDFPSNVSEFKEAGLTPASSSVVKPPRVKESPINMECKLHTLIEIGAHPGGGYLVVGTVVQMHVDNSLLNSANHIDLDKLKLIGRLSGANYVRAYHSNENIFELQRPQIK
ncbi:MAG: flavin reductase family protein [Oligoflexia bacterium]|nr:flavin reductase family protein [Oligoflexia bacterium]